ncbi:hypothetical protein [Amycolatopsis sp. DSM 110486]|uniref:hypothetical protein n=1 Tax=Amycolatopsis sp. DSM 110486 TaxID=2865832 RepID=UPI001C69512B|nr:hypothetical protein [Amycolatopsis sp. DSM 110486]QYN18892.1 hypothetical protein K1T34_40310 [Amycolatopsis sp. DSM 110486]
MPHGYTGDATEAIIAQIERFAPGFGNQIVGTAVRSATAMAVYNPNYVGGDIVTGAKDAPCSRRTTWACRGCISARRRPAGHGGHGMCGAVRPAEAALRHLGRANR